MYGESRCHAGPRGPAEYIMLHCLAPQGRATASCLVSNGGAEYRFVQFTLVRGTKDKPQEDKDGAVFVVDKQLTKKAQARPASTQLASKPDADPNSAGPRR